MDEDQDKHWRFISLERGYEYLPQPTFGGSNWPRVFYTIRVYDPSQEENHYERLTVEEEQEFKAFADRVIARIREKMEPKKPEEAT